MTIRIIRIHMLHNRFKQGYYDLKKMMERFEYVQQGLIKYQAKHGSTMKKDWGSFPNDLDRALDCIREAYSILYSHRPMRNMRDALERIKEIAEREKASEERKEQIKQLVRK